MEIVKVSDNKRGEIWKIESGKRTYFLSITKKGYGRGGDIHDGIQYNYVLEGSFKVLFKYPKEEKEFIQKANEYVEVPPEIPHVWIALEDSLMLEWHEKPLPPVEKKRYYEPYRRMIEQ